MRLSVETKELAKSYPGGVAALDRVTFQIAPGEMVGLLGPSGAGKTTLLRILTGSVRPSLGEAFVLGEHVSSLSGKALAKLRSRIAFVPQTHSTLPTLSVLYNVLMSKLGQVSFWQALRQQLAPSLQDRKQVYELLEQLGIEDKINTRAEDLSGGQQQRVAIARAVFSKPQIILADEPVASLDPGTAETIMHFLDAYRKDQGATVMMSMHQAGMALRCCSRIVALERGRLVYDGPPPGIDLKQLYGQHAKELLQEVEYGRS